MENLEKRGADQVTERRPSFAVCFFFFSFLLYFLWVYKTDGIYISFFLDL